MPPNASSIAATSALFPMLTVVLGAKVICCGLVCAIEFAMSAAFDILVVILWLVIVVLNALEESKDNKPKLAEFVSCTLKNDPSLDCSIPKSIVLRYPCEVILWLPKSMSKYSDIALSCTNMEPVLLS